MADWIRTYVNAIDTAAKANINTKIAAIDSNLATIKTAMFFKNRRPFALELPMFHQYPLTSSFDEQGLISGYDEIFINHYTGIRSFDDEGSTFINSVWVYWEAMVKGLWNTATNPGQLSGTVCRAKAIQMVSDEEEIESHLIKEAGVVWQLTLQVNLKE